MLPPPPKSPPTSALILLSFILCLMLGATYHWVKRSEYLSLNTAANNHLERLEHSLNAMLAKHAYLPRILARNPLLRDFVTRPQTSQEELDRINRYLERINSEANTADIYILNTQGTTLASSNWHADNSFVGDNYAYRPYFQQALQGKLGRYYALGARSQQRGYYFATALRDDESTIRGVITVKIDINEFEVQLKQNFGDTQFIVTDNFNVIFMSSQDNWSLKALKPLSQQQQASLAQSKQYISGIPNISTLSSTTEYLWQNTIQLLKIGNTSFLQATKPMSITGWQAHILLDDHHIHRSLFWALSITSLILALSTLLLYLGWRFVAQRRHYERSTRFELERKVRQRTKQLENTQQELIQAAKMAALGQLASSINHELNNPLAAIRSYTDNAQQFLSLERTDMVQSNLEQIIMLTERMASITRQLKSFSRKSQGNIQACHLPHAISSTLTIVRHKLEHIQIHEHYVSHTQVQADQLWLEQILLNLISNAIEACAHKKQAEIRFTTFVDVQSLILHIHDNGDGILNKHLEHIFEAFYTTKDQSSGLGLGLSISSRLAQDMHGTLSATNHKNGGAIFSLSLPLVETCQDE